MQSHANRPRTLAGKTPAELEGLFARGVPPEPPLDGRYDGALLDLTLGPGGDLLFGAVFRLWLPWLGKRFDAEAATGENVFDMSAYRAGERLTPAGFRAWWPEDVSSYRALRFRTAVTSGRLDPGVDVLRIDYDLPENPPLLRRIVDELVAVQTGVYLGQAILRRGNGGRRLAWFTLE
ncbi:MAG TPA: hypothetical protein VFX13_04890 [Gaiellales bacterium]|nr:hypothetical protein [Gaiellales bacterium]